LATCTEAEGVAERAVTELKERIPWFACGVCAAADQYETKNSAATIDFAIIQPPFCGIIREIEKT
jgi:hypothetical protein